MTACISFTDIYSGIDIADGAGRTAATRCPHCGHPDAEAFQVLSRHETATGQAVWTRCACGSLQWRVRDAAGERIVTRGPMRR